MALARIITRSQLCSRALALDLLARGYAVEIVSPDKIPDNFADLELRVDNSLGDQLIANVEAHNGGRTASLEFVHHLKAPMVNFMRRPPEHGEADRFSAEPVRFEAAPGIEDRELRAETPQLAPAAVSSATEILLNRELDSEVDRKEDASPILPQVASQPPAEPPGCFAVEEAAASQPTMARARPIIASPITVPPIIVSPITVSPVIVPPITVPPVIAAPITVPPTPAAQLRHGFRHRSAGWPWRVALTFASMMLLAAVLGFSVRRTTTKDAAPDFEALPLVEIGVASTGVNPTSAVGAEKDAARDPRQASAVSLSPAAAESDVSSSQLPKDAPAAQIGASTASPRTTVSGNDFIARDTVTYLDKRFEPAPKVPLAKDHLPGSNRSRTTQVGAIAANTLGDLNKAAPKAAK
jgi:hypothetical protein